MNHASITLISLLAIAVAARGQMPARPATDFRILYLDRPFTEEETKAIEDGTMSRVVELLYPTENPAAPGKESTNRLAITRNQISSTQTYVGAGPISLRLANPPNSLVANIPVPQSGGSLLVVLKSQTPGKLDGSSVMLIGSDAKDLPPGHLCLANVTAVRLAFNCSGSPVIVGPGKQHIFSPERLRMNAVPLEINADTKPTATCIFQGALRLAPQDRIVFVVYSPPGSPGVFQTEFFMLQTARNGGPTQSP